MQPETPQRGPDPRRGRRGDPHYVNQAVVDGRPDITTDADGNIVAPIDPPWLQDDPPAEVSDQGDTWKPTAASEPESGEQAVGDGERTDGSVTGQDSASTASGTDDKMEARGLVAEVELREMSRSALVNYAADHGVSTSGKDTKDDLVSRLVEAGKVRS
jgi:hypothetical protein